ncbi:mercury(II) reductase [Hydrogenivirga sp.]
MLRLKITGMTCEHCALTVKRALESVEGVKAARVYFPQGFAEVETEKGIELSKLMEAVRNSGYGAEPLEGSPEVYVPRGGAYDLFILGGGSAGFAAAIRAVELGAKRVLIAEERVIGGTCLNRGCIPSKYFIEAANMLFTPKGNPIPSVEVEGAKLDFRKLVELKEELLTELRKEKYWNVLEAYPQIEYAEGHAEFSGSGRAKVGEREINFHRAIVSSGSRPFIPPVEGIEEVPYITSDEVFDLCELPEHLLIVGGGAIGLELGQAFLRFGSRVTLIEALPDIVMGEEPELRKRLRELLEREGMEIYTSVRLERVSGKEGGITLKLSSDGKEFEIEGTHLLVATGRRANTERVGLDRVGVEVNDRGFVKVNDFLQTTNPDIYGAGDCIDRALLVTVAALEGGVAARNALLGNRERVDYSSIPHAVFTEPELASVGLTEEEAKKEGHEVDVRVLEFSKVPRAIISFRTEGLVKMVADSKTERVLGVHVLAPHGADIIHKAVPVVKYGLKIEDVINMVDVYPTLSESIKLCAQTFKKDVSKLSCCAQ